MAVKEENLDDVISSLIDDDPGNEEATSGLPGFPEVSGEVDEHPITLTERAAKQIRK